MNARNKRREAPEAEGEPINEANFRMHAKRALETYQKKGMILDALVWGKIIGLYESALTKLDVAPLNDKEVRELSAWETDAEVPAFRQGWLYRREHGPEVQCPGGKQRTEYATQNERVSWERGWMACDAVYRALVQEEKSEEVKS